MKSTHPQDSKTVFHISSQFFWTSTLARHGVMWFQKFDFLVIKWHFKKHSQIWDKIGTKLNKTVAKMWLKWSWDGDKRVLKSSKNEVEIEQNCCQNKSKLTAWQLIDLLKVRLSSLMCYRENLDTCANRSMIRFFEI